MSISNENTTEASMIRGRFVSLFAVMVAYSFAVAASGGSMNWRWDFENGVTNQPPAGFGFSRTGEGRQGNWVIQKENQSRGGSYVLAQVDTDKTSDRFPVAVANEPVVRDLRVSVRCKPVSGKVDQACGLVLRYRDENNYYVARANALEDNVRFYYVAAGKRHQLASWSGKVTSGVWHSLGVEAKGNRFQVFWNNQKVIEARDATFSEAGKLGLWTKADSVTYFDDLLVEENQGG
jgi:hypothetical protein